MIQSKKRPWYSPLRLFLYAFALLVLVIVLSNLAIILSSAPFLYDDVRKVPAGKTGIVLGTSHHLRSGKPNPYFHYRMSAAAELYHAGKVQYLILSGDNRTRYYNEPAQMRSELRKYDVPDSVMYLDYAGLRTLDSMVRSREIFGQDSIIVISQKFHNQRAVFLARRNGINALGYNASTIDRRQGMRTSAREVLARVKVFYDLITKKQPRHLGDKINIGTE